MQQSTNKILGRWRLLSGLPCGKIIYSFLLGRMIPFSGIIRFRIDEMETGHTLIYMRDRKRLRNHLNSLHAIALANLGELASGLAILTCVPDSMRGIPTRFEIAYYKKARGRVSASADFSDTIDLLQSQEYKTRSIVRDEQGDTVAEFTACWLIGPRPRS